MNSINVSHVYCILNTYTNKRYVGSTSRTISYRKKQHLYQLRKGNHHSKLMQQDYNQYGEKSFVFFNLEDVWTFDRDELLGREQHWLDSYKPEYNTNESAWSRIPNSGKSVEARRKQALAIAGRKQSQETKDKRAASIRKFWSTHPPKTVPPDVRKHLSEINTGKGNPNWGRKRSVESRQRTSDAVSKIKVRLLSPEGVEYRVEKLAQFCREHKLDYFQARRVAIGRRKSHKGWTKIPDDVRETR